MWLDVMEEVVVDDAVDLPAVDAGDPVLIDGDVGRAEPRLIAAPHPLDASSVAASRAAARCSHVKRRSDAFRSRRAVFASSRRFFDAPRRSLIVHSL